MEERRPLWHRRTGRCGGVRERTRHRQRQRPEAETETETERVRDTPLAPQDGTLCNEREEMTPQDFEAAMRQQLTLFLQVQQSARPGLSSPAFLALSGPTPPGPARPGADLAGKMRRGSFRSRTSMRSLFGQGQGGSLTLLTWDVHEATGPHPSDQG